MAETSRRFCGVPSGRLRSHTTLALETDDCLHHAPSARRYSESSPVPMLMSGGFGAHRSARPARPSSSPSRKVPRRRPDRRCRAARAAVCRFPRPAPRSRTGKLCLVAFADQRRQHVGSARDRSHRRDRRGLVGIMRQIARSVLAVVGPAHLHTGDLGDSIGSVGGFEGTREQVLFANRLRAIPRIDTRGAEKHETRGSPARQARVNDVRLNRQVFVDELGGKVVVGGDAAYLGGTQQHELRSLGRRRISPPRPLSQSSSSNCGCG